MRRLTYLLVGTALLLGPMLVLPFSAYAQDSVSLSVAFGPPPLPYYPQPFAPAPGYIWVPGYWLYGAYGYYWVPGTWVLAPAVGLLWTPGYWGWRDGSYWWHPGYWGEHVGYYGDIDYGYGYPGEGYEGGYWRGHNFYYNRAANHVDATYFHHTYDREVMQHEDRERVSYHGGDGGTLGGPTPQQQAYVHEPHIFDTRAQTQQARLAQNQPGQRYFVNHGMPGVVATARSGKFNGEGVVHMNARHDAYIYHPGRQEYPDVRKRNSFQQESRLPEHGGTPDQYRYRNDQRAAEVQPRNRNGKRPESGELRHAGPPAYRHPPRPPSVRDDRERPPPWKRSL